MFSIPEFKHNLTIIGYSLATVGLTMIGVAVGIGFLGVVLSIIQY